jgi:serine/threonine protein kinase
MENRTTLFPGSEDLAVPLKDTSKTPTQSRNLPVEPSVLPGYNGQRPARIDSFSRIRINAPVRLNIFDKDPWTKYTMFMKDDQAGPAILAYDRDRPEKIFAVKEIEGLGKNSLGPLRAIIHSNIVRFIVAYYHKGSCFLFYDEMSVSLIDLLSSPSGNLKINDIATICLDITEALAYLHKDLRICYGVLDMQNVLLSKSGEVKLGNELIKAKLKRLINCILANVGESMLNNRGQRPRGQDMQRDLQSLGQLLITMLHSNPPPSSAINFVERTQMDTATDLLQVCNDHLAQGGLLRLAA